MFKKLVLLALLTVAATTSVFAVSGTITYSIKANPDTYWSIYSYYNRNWNDYGNGGANGYGTQSGTFSFDVGPWKPYVYIATEGLGAQAVPLTTGDLTVSYTASDYVENPTESKGWWSNLIGEVAQQVNVVRAKVGGSINLATGAEEFSKSLLTVQGARTLNFSIAYSSFYSQLTSGRSPLGLGMSHSFEGGVTIDSSDNATVRTGNSYLHFQKDSSGDWDCETDLVKHTSFIQRVDGTMQLSSGDGDTVEFDSTGKIVSTADPSGNLINYTYAIGKLSQVTDAATSKYIAFTYDLSDRLTQAQDNAGRTITFAYPSASAENFNDLTDARGKTTNYGFGADGKLLSVNDHNGARITTNFFSGERVYRQDDARWSSMYYMLEFTGPEFTGTLTDRNGKVHVYTFNTDRLLTSYTDPMNRTTAWEYNAAGQITKVTYPSGRYVEYVNDTNGDVTASSDSAYGSSVTYATVGGVDSGLPATITAPGSRTTSFTRDSVGRPTTITAPDSTSTSFTYNGAGQPTSVAGSNGTSLAIGYTSSLPTSVTIGGVTTAGMSYDSAGRLSGMTLPGSRTFSSTLDGNGNVLSETGPGSRTLAASYDIRSRPTLTTLPDGTTNTYSWDANHNLSWIKDGLNRTTSYTYDGENRLLTVTMPGSRTVTFARDDSGRVTSVTSPGGKVVSYTYDADGNLLTTTFPDATALGTTYDIAGLVATTVNQSGKTTAYTYDVAGNLASVTSPESRVNSYTYDSFGRMMSSTMPSTKAATAYYNSATRASTIFDPDGKSTLFNVDVAGCIESFTTNGIKETTATYWEDNLVDSLTSPSGDETTFAYDAYRMLSSVTTGDGTISYTRDTMGRITATTDGLKTVSRAYDLLGRLISYTDQDSNVVGYAYNTAGFLQTVTYPDSSTVSYTYNLDGELTKVTDWASRETIFARDSMGRVSSVTFPNGAKNEYTYTPTGRVATITNKETGGTPFLTRTVSYSDDGFLVSDSAASAPAALPADATLTFDADNRVVSFNGSSLSFDDDGNLLHGPTGLSPPYSLGTLSYDHSDRLLSAGGVGSEYDPEGRRVVVTTSSGDTKFIYDTVGGLDQVIVRTDPSSTTTKYVTAPGLGIIYEETGGNIKAYHYDTRGSTVALTDNSGVVCDTFTYGPYGELTGHTGGTATPFQYNGQFGVQTDENGLLSMRARFYSPALKRFVNQDTFLGDVASPLSLNRYAYADGDPISNADPFGFVAQDAQSGWSAGWSGALTADCPDSKTFEIFMLIGGAQGGGAEGATQGLSGDIDALTFGNVKGAFGADPESWGYNFGRNTTYVGMATVAVVGTAGVTVPGGAVIYGIAGRATQVVAAIVPETVGPGVIVGGTTVAVGKKVVSAGRNIFAARAKASLAERILAADRSGSGLKADATHRAASFLTKEQLEAGTSFTIKGGDDIVRELLQTPGGMNGKTGIFEYILDPTKGVTHQRFIPGGKITGVPNQKMP